MGTEKFICSILGVSGATVDWFCDEFDVDFTDDEFYQILDDLSGDLLHDNLYIKVGNVLMQRLWDKVISEYRDRLDEDKFDCVIDGSVSKFYYDGEIVTSKKDLEKYETKDKVAI